MAKIEVFIAGCPLCDEAVETVKQTACPNCEVTIYDLRTDTTALGRAKQYGINRVPAVAVNGKLSSCCEGSKVDPEALRAAGVG